MYKVLIIEDESIIRRGLKYMFDWAKLNCLVVDEAENGKEGLEKIKLNSPDLIVLDINMPIMNGIEMLKSFNEKDFETIILSGYDEFEYAKEAISLDVVNYILKPVDYEELEKSVKKAIDRINKNQDVKSIDKDINEKLNALNSTRSDISRNFSSTTNKVLQYIETNYMNKITIDDLIKETQRSKTSINRKFKEDTSQTIIEYINMVRIKKAITLMMEHDYSIEKISFEVGFLNYRYFSQVFKKYMDMNPSEFQKIYK